MLKNLKISMGIYIPLFIMTILLIGIIGFGYYSATNSSQQFSQFVKVNQNHRVLDDAMRDVNNLIERIHTLSLVASQGNRVETSALGAARQSVTAAQEKLVHFASLSHDKEDREIVTDLKTHAENLLKLVTSRLENIDNSKDIIVQMNKIAAANASLKDKLQQYSLRSDIVINSIEAAALANNYRFNIMAFSIGVITLALVFFTRLWLKRELFKRLDETVQTFQIMSTGKLDEEILTGRLNEIGLMFIELEKLRQWVTQTVSSIRSGVSRINTSAREIVSGNNDLSKRTEAQASSLQQTAASMEELKITVRQNADNAHTARQLAESASGSARNGGEVMAGLDIIMRRIIESSRQIGDINSVIDSIANQTNILALNAAVEAARAGEQGRGFAVVAGEVRNLAKRSADAAKEIRTLINTCVADMNIGSQEVEQAGTAMQQIIHSVSQVTDIMAEIASASDEQSSGINQIAQAVNELDLVTQQNATMVEQAAAAAISMEGHAEQLGQMVAHIKLKDEAVYSPIENKPAINHVTKSSEKKAKDNELDHINPVEEWESF